MKPRLLSSLCAILLGVTTLLAQPSPSPSYADLVNPLIGTQSSFELSSGNTYPVIARPWGMNAWTPQTGKMGDGWQYSYNATKLRGFKQTHQPSPWINDYGQFSIFPEVASTPIFDEERRASWFSHKSEIARPYAYEVYLADYDTEVRLSPTERAVTFEIAFPKQAHPDSCWVLIDAFDSGSELHQQDPYTLVGISRKNSGGVPANVANYFIVRFAQPITALREQITEGKGGRHAQVAVRLKRQAGEIARLAAASSFISPDQARLNLQEVGTRSYAEVRQEGKALWNSLLGRIAVKDDLQRARTFYSCLYRSLLFPRRFYEVDAKGSIVHYSPYSGQVRPGYMYTDTGFWDTFRALMPLINLVYSE